MTWSELNQETTSTPSVKFCNFYDLGYPLVMCWLILAVRFTLERGVFRAIGVSAGITTQGDRWRQVVVLRFSRHCREISREGSFTVWVEIRGVYLFTMLTVPIRHWDTTYCDNFSCCDSLSWKYLMLNNLE